MKKLLYTFLLTLISAFVYSQVDVLNHIGGNPAWYVGWDNSVLSNTLNLNVEHQGTQNINFLTGGIQRATILGTNAGANAGFIGIGIANPTFLLDVAGNINIDNPVVNNGYRLRGITVLQSLPVNGNLFLGENAGINNTDRENTFLGISAGNQNTTGRSNTYVGLNSGQNGPNGSRNTFVGVRTGLNNLNDENTFVGYEAGVLNNTGFQNTFLGAQSGRGTVNQGFNTYVGFAAGSANDRGENTFVGFSAGTNNNGNSNSFLGASAGSNNLGSLNTFLGHGTAQFFSTGDANVFVGARSGLNAQGENNVFIGFGTGEVNRADNNVFVGINSGIANTIGERNCFSGSNAGAGNTSGRGNSFYGANSGNTNSTGNNNTLIGAFTGTGPNNNLNNATALGANATVLNNNRMILGDNQVNVGIGLSGVQGGPHWKLHILDDANVQLRLSHTYDATVTSGIWTDFQTTSQGDLLINTQRMNGQNAEPHFVGINCSTALPPLNTLEINSTALSPQLAGLRFRNLTNGVNPVTNPDPQKGVLSVDGNGDVIFVYDEGGNSGVFTCQSPGPVLNRVVKFSNVSGSPEVCNTIAYDDGNGHFGINTNITNPTQQLFYTFQNANNALFSNTPPSAMLPTFNTNVGVRTPLAVQTHVDGNSRFGLIVYSNQPVIAPGNIPSSDHFKIYVENNTGPMSGITDGQSIIETLGKPITFRRRGPWGLNTTVEDYLTIYPQEENVIIKRDFSTSPVNYPLSLWFRPHFYVETTLPQNEEKYNSSVWGNHLGSGDNPYYNQIGVRGTSFGVRNSLFGINIGGQFEASGSNRNIGGFFNATGGNIGYGLFATVQNPNCAGGTPNNCPRAAGYFNGPVYSTVNFFPSDSSLKTNLQLIPDTFDILNNLNVYSYQFDTLAAPQMNLPAGTRYGLISQEVENLLPQFVNTLFEPATSDTGTVIFPEKQFLALNYNEFIPLLIKGHQIQSHLIDTLISRLDSLRQQLNSCCNLRITAPENTGSIELENIRSMQLFTADPNPFSESTIIRWSLPDDFGNAVIYFYDDKGNRINQCVITEKGNGELQIFGSKLSSGVYSYTLVVDNRIVETRRMAKVK